MNENLLHLTTPWGEHIAAQPGLILEEAAGP
jgi:hypothetical protein